MIALKSSCLPLYTLHALIDAQKKLQTLFFSSKNNLSEMVCSYRAIGGNLAVRTPFDFTSALLSSAGTQLEQITSVQHIRSRLWLVNAAGFGLLGETALAFACHFQ